MTMNNHQAGVTPSAYKQSSELTSFFNVLSTNFDRDGNPFLSTIEGLGFHSLEFLVMLLIIRAGKNFPVFGSQWHPEKNPFEWTPSEVCVPGGTFKPS